jgi:outer membrane lipase/esterase
MWSGLDAPRSGKRFEAWAAYDYASIDMNAGANNASGNANTVAVGGDMKISDRLLAGMMFTYVENKTDFSGEGGGFKLRQPIFTLYGGYGEGPWYLGATFGAGSLDYTGINRNIDLGPLVRNESGQSRGYEYTGRLLGGYWFTQGEWQHGPFAKLTWEKAVLHQFSERGNDSTALSYGEQKRKSLSAGWQVAGKYGGVRPWARARGI